jgi:hypothetical protein
MTREIDVEAIRRYLLHDSPEDEASAIEERYFGDPQRLEEVQDVETELLDQYVRGRLPEADRLRLERHYLDSPARRERVGFARALAAVVDAEPAHPDRRPDALPGRRKRWSTHALPIAASVVLALMTVGLAGDRARLRREVDGLAAEAERLRAGARQVADQLSAEQQRSEALAATVERLRAAAASVGPDSAEALFTVLLSPLLRGASEPEISWPPSVRDVEMRLGGDLGRYATYRVVIERNGADAVWAGEGRRITLPRGEAIAVRLPAARMPAGGYVVTLQGVSRDGAREDLHRYSFAVARPRA